MKIVLLRHGETAGNREKRYTGNLDVEVTPEGLAALRPAGFVPDLLYTTTLRRTAQTAAILFPGVAQNAVHGLREMELGAFTGRSYAEMNGEKSYQEWIDAGAKGKIPGGESQQEFTERVCAAFVPLVEDALARGCGCMAVVAHGGTQMALLSVFGRPRQDYFSWLGENGCGFLCETDAARWGERILDVVGPISCRKDLP